MREGGLVELGFGRKLVEDEVVEQAEPELGLEERTGGVCFTG